MPNAKDNIEQQLKELIYQQYNHPSIAVWGISNEITMFKADKKDLIADHVYLNNLVHKIDPNRKTVLACFAMCGPMNKIAHITDVVSWNLYLGWYVPGLFLNDFWLHLFHLLYPKRCIGYSEYGAEGMPNLHSSHPKIGDNSEEYQAHYHEFLLRCFARHPYLWATHVWNMFDFASDGRDQGGEPGRNHKGLVTIDRKIKKDSFYLYKAYWSDEPFVHIASKRYVNRIDKKATITVYSNQKHLTFIHNGKVIEKDGTVKYVVNIAPVVVADAEGNNKYYSSLQDAVKNAKNGETITLRNEAATDGVVSGGGVVVPSGSNFTLDLNGLTYCVSKDMVGSAGSETNGFQLLKDSNITIKNGTLTKSIDYVNGSMLIQNYSNLTLDNAKLIGTSNIKYVVSNNYGNVTFKNSTEISATEGNYAFDAYFWPKAYEEGVTVTIVDDTVKINGKVGYASGRQTEEAYNKVNIIMPAGYQLTLDDGLVLETTEDGKTQEVTTSDVAAAKDFASLWKNVRNSEGGLCAIVGTSAMDDLLTKFDNLSAKSKEYLESVQDADGVTVAYSVNYFKTLQQTKASTSTEPGIKTTLLNTSSESNNVAMIVLFAMLGIAGVVSYYYIEKRKVNN